MLLFQSMVQLFQPACTDLLETMSHELMSLSVSDCKISHYMSIIEAFCDTVTIAQSMDTVKLTIIFTFENSLECHHCLFE